MNPDFQLIDTGWNAVFEEAAIAGSNELRIVCPFIKLSVVKRLLAGKRRRMIQVITRFNLAEMCEGVNDLTALRLLLKSGASIRGVKGLHAKLYLFDSARAVVTSANLTEAALRKNHEFGFVSSETVVVANCHSYFERLWQRAGTDLDEARLSAWEQRVEAAQTTGARPTISSGLGDEGTNAGTFAHPNLIAVSKKEAPQCFVKFFGEANRRANVNIAVIDEVKRSGCHWACSYPRTKRPRSVKDGAVMFMGRLVQQPNDIIIYGRAIAMQHKPGRDEASSKEIELRDWKTRWPIYARVHHAEFVAGTLAHGIRLSTLMDEFAANSFTPTQRNAANGSGNINPRGAFREQPQVRLTEESAAWLDQKLESAFKLHGKLSAAELDTLDWPAGKSVLAESIASGALHADYQSWLIANEGKAQGTVKIYARFLVRCAEHYGERIDTRNIPNVVTAERVIERVRAIVEERGRWADGTFNEEDVIYNLGPALKAFGRFAEATNGDS